MSIQNFSNSDYQMLYEAKLQESGFLVEQNITPNDIIAPLEDLITEEFINKILQKGAGIAKGVAQTAKNVASTVKSAVTNFFQGVVNFFKNFSLKKLTNALWSKVKEIGNKTFKKLKELLSGFSEFIISNNLADAETGKPIFKNIWAVICSKVKNDPEFKEAVLDDKQLAQIGSNIVLNEAKENQISDEEVKYLGFFQKVAHALGIKNARFNGVVSQIIQKGSIGMLIMTIVKASGYNLGALAGSMLGGISLGPVALTVIGGMLLMAGLIILAIWICKPYPTIKDCLAYLHLAYNGYAGNYGLDPILQPTDTPQQEISFSVGSDREKESKPNRTRKLKIDNSERRSTNISTELMVDNLEALENLINSYDDLKILRRGLKQENVNFDNTDQKIYEVLLLLEEIDIRRDDPKLFTAIKKARRAVRVLVNQKDKGLGVNSQFLADVIEESDQAAEYLTQLYSEIYGFLRGSNQGKLPKYGKLFKENIEYVTDGKKRKILAEKIAKFAKRTLQFEKVDLYDKMGEFGENMREFNETLTQILDSFE